MGNEQCTSGIEQKLKLTQNKNKDLIDIEETNEKMKLLIDSNNSYDINYYLNYSNYDDYFKMRIVIIEKIRKILLEISSNKKFEKKNNIKKLIGSFSYYEILDPDIDKIKLFDIVMNIYQRIIRVYKSVDNYPKEELNKINYDLVYRYQIYFHDEENEMNLVSEKIIKRINFFSEGFILKLKRIKKTFMSHKIYVFGYDINYRLNFYIEPHITTSKSNENENLNNKIFDFKLENSDYVIYIFFIMELFLPVLCEKYNFSKMINIIINFNGKEPNTEMINYIFNSMKNYYPLLLNKLHIVNFDVNLLSKNFSFLNEIQEIDIFRNIIFHDGSYKFKLIKNIEPNCLPIEYGGYHSLESFYSIIKDDLFETSIDNFIYLILSMILVNDSI